MIYSHQALKQMHCWTAKCSCLLPGYLLSTWHSCLRVTQPENKTPALCSRGGLRGLSIFSSEKDKTKQVVTGAQLFLRKTQTRYWVSAGKGEKHLLPPAPVGSRGSMGSAAAVEWPLHSPFLNSTGGDQPGCTRGQGINGSTMVRKPWLPGSARRAGEAALSLSWWWENYLGELLR